MADLSALQTAFSALANPIQTGLTGIAVELLTLAGKDIYDAAKSKFSAGIILYQSWRDFRNGYLKEAEDDSKIFNIYQGFYRDSRTKEEFKKILSGQQDEIDFPTLKAVFIEHCHDQGKYQYVPDYRFEQGILDTIEVIETLAKKHKSFREQIELEKISAILQTLQKPGQISNLTLAEEQYYKQLMDVHGNLRFTGIPDYKEKKDIAIPSVFVMPRVVEELPTRDYLRARDLLTEAEPEETFSEEIYLRTQFRLEQREEQHQPLKFDRLLQETNDRRFVILGVPGSGKSTLLRYLTLAFCQNQFRNWLHLEEPYFPILVEIRKFDRSLLESRRPDYNVYDYLYDSVRADYHMSLPQGFFEKHLQEGKALLLFDGLDEVADDARRLEIRDKIHTFVNGLPPEHLVFITSRIAGYSRTHFRVERYRHFTLLDFNDEEQEEFIKKWYRARLDNEGEIETQKQDLLQALKPKPNIKELAANPLLLTIIAVIHRYEAELPEDRLTLYDKATESLLYQWDNVRQIIDQKFTLRRKRQFLEKVGYTLQCQEKGEESGTLMHRKQLESLLLEDFKQAFQCDDTAAADLVDEFIERIRLRSGLVVELGPGQYGFVHKTFQEYFAARYIAREVQRKRSNDFLHACIDNHLTNPFWQETLLLSLRALEFPEHAKEALNYILQNNSYGAEDLLYLDHYFVLKFLGEQTSWLEDREFVEKQMKAFLQWTRRNWERDYLVGNKPWERFQNWIGETTDITFKEILFYLLLSIAEGGQQDGFSQRNFAYALSQLGYKDTVAIERLLSLTEDDQQDGLLRNFCAKALGKVVQKDPAVIDRLLSLAENSQQDGVLRCDCVEAVCLSGHKDPAVIDRLFSLAEDDQQDSELRFFCTCAVGELGRRDSAVFDRLLSLAEDGQQDGDLRYYCAFTAGQWGQKDSTVIDRLLSLAEDDQQDGELRYCCAFAVGELGQKNPAVKILLSLVEDDKQDSMLRRECAEALGELGHKDIVVIDRLLSLAEDGQQERNLRGFCAFTAGQLGHKDPVVIDRLLRLAEDDQQSDDLRRDFVEAVGLSGHKNPVVIDRLLSLAEDDQQDDNLRHSCTSAIGRLGHKDPAVIGRLLSLAEDDQQHEGLRCACAAAVGLLGQNGSALKILLSLAEDVQQGSHLRCACAKALGQLGERETAVRLLVYLYREKDDNNTYRALWELTAV